MSWDVLFRIREYLKGSLRLFPPIGAILGPLAANPLLSRRAARPVCAGRRKRQDHPCGVAVGQSWFQQLARP